MKILQALLVFSFVLLYNLFGQDYSLSFDGQDDYVRIPDHTDLDLTENYTIEAWIFAESFSWLAGIVSKYQTNAANGYMLRLTAQAPYTGIGFDEIVTANGVLSSNQWHHIAAVNNEGDRKVFINGSEVTLSGNPLTVVANNNAIRIGSDYGGRYFDGRIDEVRIWEVPRQQDDIVSDMYSTLSGHEDGLVAYYSFNEGSGNILYDQTENGHDGSIMGDQVWLDGYTVTGNLGDINFDEILNIYDAVMLVAIMLAQEEGTELQMEACDTNQDGIIDIEDIVLLFEWILGLDRSHNNSLTQGSYYIQNNRVMINSDGDIAGFQVVSSNSEIIDFADLPIGWSWNQSGNHYIAFSTDGTPLPPNFSITMDQIASIESIKLVGWGRNSVQAKEELMPSDFNLMTFPNPFNPVCKISFQISSEKNIKINCFNLHGQHLQTIHSGQMEIGNHKINWYPDDLASGVYFISITDNSNSEIQKVMFIK
tara:strand:- start:1533 stop:2972 length:1440 start_codon:yes stop_codon:yes gene_type:complete